MRRRAFITLLGGAIAWPVAARAQDHGRSYRLGCLLPTEDGSPAWLAFLDELRLNGFVKDTWRLPSSSGDSRLMPVVLPPGLDNEATKPSRTMSSLMPMME